MANSRAFCDMDGNDHALVPPVIEVRDNLGALAVQILAAQNDLNDLPYSAMLDRLHEIIVDLHAAYEPYRLLHSDE